MHAATIEHQRLTKLSDAEGSVVDHTDYRDLLYEGLADYGSLVHKRTAAFPGTLTKLVPHPDC